MRLLAICLLTFYSTRCLAAPNDLPVSIKTGKLIYASQFGFSQKATPAKNTKALQAVSQYINASGGDVTLIFNKGIYRIGVENFSGSQGRGFSYRGDTLLKITGCKKPIFIEGNGAVLKLADGMHFGSFDPKSGEPYHPPKGGFTNYDYTAYPTNILDLRKNKAVTVKDLVVDGNIQNMNVGGYWGDVDIQLPADGIYASDNEVLILQNLTSRYCGRDGLQIGNTTPQLSTPIRKINIYNCVFDGNTRQGFSWVGGNHLNVVNTQFINTGKTVVKSGGVLRSSPGAGVDMEAELGLIRNGVFNNCLIYNNDGAGMLTVGDVANISYVGGKIIGTTNWSIYGTGTNALFRKTLIVGSPVNLRVGSGPMDQLNAKFDSCRITLNPAYSPNKQVYGRYVMDFGGGAGGFFNNCIIDSYDRGTIYGGGGCVFINCVFYQQSTAPGYNGYAFMQGNFYGTNKWFRPGTGYKIGNGSLNNLEKSKFFGPFYINDVEIGTGFKSAN